jgi:NADPH-dependent glutamate synthase beta subunit-like oxidoreductase
MAAAYQLRRLGHGATVFDERAELGGMARYGIPGYRMPRDVMDGEMRRILDMGVETRMNTRVGRDISFEQLEQDYDAILLAIGAQQGRTLSIPGGDAPNCVSGVAFLAAFNEGRMKHTAKKVVVIGGGDTAMDVVSVARRLGHIQTPHENDRPEAVIQNHTAHDVAATASREGSEVMLIYRRPIENMPAAEHERITAKKEGIELRGNLAPVSLVIGTDGRATALRVIEVDWSSGKMVEKEGSEFDIECDLVVPAVGQSGDMTGLEQFDNGRGLVDADPFYQIPGKPGYFACGDIVRPHLLTTAIGQAAVTVDTIDRYLRHAESGRRPKVDVHHFNLLEKLRETALAPEQYPQTQDWGTDTAAYAVHNYEDRSQQEIIPHEMLYLGHFPYTPRHQRLETGVGADEVLGHFEERFQGLDEAAAQAEAGRCMSCGMCFECDNCVIYCPQDAVKRTPKERATMGRYVYTDYDRCVGCHICAEVCPTGYINMGLGA